MAISRNFDGELYPVVDMVNHADEQGRNVRPVRYIIGADGTRQDGRGFVSTRDIKAGEELRETYAFSSQASAQQMQLVYGLEIEAGGSCVSPNEDMLAEALRCNSACPEY